MIKKLSILLMASAIVAGCSFNPTFSGYKTVDDASDGPVDNLFEFNGYLNFWESVYKHEYRYGNLYKLNVTDVQKDLMQNRLDLASALGLPFLQMQEGFLNGLLDSKFDVLENPALDEMKSATRKSSNLLVFAERDSDAGVELSALAPPVKNPGSYQRNSKSFSPIDAFMLKKGDRTIYAVVGEKEDISRFHSLVNTAVDVVNNYELKKGWFGVGTHTQSVTCSPCDQFDVISKGMNEGNSWFIFNGLYEYMSQQTTPAVLAEVGCPAILDFGSSPLYGSDFSDFQVQLMFSSDDWKKYREEHGGYMSGGVPAKPGDKEDCDFFIAEPGVAEIINHGTKPFAIGTGEVISGTRQCMVLFNKKGEEFNREKIWENIMNRRAVAVCGITLMGEDCFRQTLQMLILDRLYLEEYFADRVNLNVSVEKDNVHILATNFYNRKLSCTFSVEVPSGVEVNGPESREVSFKAGETKEIVFELSPSSTVMGKRNAVLVNAKWDSNSKSTIANYQMPPAVSVHKLLYGTPSVCAFPVSIHNITSKDSVEVNVSVSETANSGTAVFTAQKKIPVEKGTYSTVEFNLDLPQGAYTVTTSAMGVEAFTQLGIGSGQGTVTVWETDLDGDGMNEYVMENDKVRVSLIRVGARAIELYVKDRDDNVFFKLWPDKPEDCNRSYRFRGFWPFGGFEDFLGQGSAETFKVFDAEIIRDDSKCASVRMTGDLYGNIIEKTYTLYADSPMLEARFALDFINPEMNVLGPQPILELGKKHWTEDKFYIPTAEGLECRVMMPERYYGSLFFPTEGWHSGYDSLEDVSFIGAFPVNRPMYLHMWMNHPRNGDSHYYYCEFQPWITIEQGVTSYFSYYMWAESGPWEKSLEQMKYRNLISVK